MNHISYSQISTYLKCGEKYRRNYIEMEKLPPNAAMVCGSSIHYGLEVAAKTIIDGGDRLDTETVITLALQYWEGKKGDINWREWDIQDYKDRLEKYFIKKNKTFESEHKKALKYIDSEHKKETKKSHLSKEQLEQVLLSKLEEKSHSFDSFMKKEINKQQVELDSLDDDAIVERLEKEQEEKIERLTRVYYDQFGKTIKPFKAEMPFEVTLMEGFPPIRGFIDLIEGPYTMHDDKEAYSIIDIKTASKSPLDNDIYEDFQISIYDLAYRQKFGKKPYRLKKVWAVDTAEPKVVAQSCEARSDEQIKRVKKRIQLAVECIAKGVFLPAPQGCWWCGERWCDYWDDCQVRP